MRETSDSAVLASWLQSQDSEGLWDNDSLLGVVWWWDSLENLQAGESGLTARGLVGDHTADGLVEDTGRSAEMERTVVLVVSGGLAKVGVVLHYKAKNFSFPISKKFPPLPISSFVHPKFPPLKQNGFSFEN